MQEPFVVIAGAGPVGLSLAAALVRERIPVTVCEALPALSSEARASTFHPPTLEMFAEWGVLGPVLAQGRRIDELQYWERKSRSLVARFDYSLIAGDTPYPFRLQCPQSVVTRILAPHVDASGYGRVLFDHAVVGAKDCGDFAEAIVAHGGEEHIVRAPFVVGADGSKSAVRTSLGLGLSGETYQDRFLLVATDLNINAHFPNMGPVSYVFDPDEWVIVMHLPDVVRVVFRLDDQEDEAEARSEASVRGRMAKFLGEETPFQIHGVSTYSVHRRVCDTFRSGRVLLAGDAAHINNPAGGMGMNSGIHDAHRLAQGLKAVYYGASPEVLDRYAEERRRAAVDDIQRNSDKNYRDLSAREAGACEARNQELREAAADTSKARDYLLRASMLSARWSTEPTQGTGDWR